MNGMFDDGFKFRTKDVFDSGGQPAAADLVSRMGLLIEPKTDTPAWLSVQAAVAPAGPMPTMRTSYDSDSDNAGMNTRGLLPEIPTYSVSLKKAGDHGQGVCIDHHPDHDEKDATDG
jgi:hypothetical protein